MSITTKNDSPGSFIPEIWSKKILQEQLNGSPIWAHFVTPGPRVPLTRRQRLRIWRRRKLSGIREAIARRVYPEGPWDGDDW